MKNEIKIGLIPAGPEYFSNRLFDSKEGPFFEWKRSLAVKRVEFSTIDIFKDIDSLDAIIWIESPFRRDFPFEIKYQNLVRDFKGIKILLLYECEVICPENYNKNTHQLFDYVLTWNDDLIDNKKYFKFLWAQFLGNKPRVIKRKSGFLTLMNANKIAFHQKELYSERLTAINFFQKNFPNKFDLYGYGWDKSWKTPLLFVLFQAIKLHNINYIFEYIIALKTPSAYRGIMKDKMEVLQRYKFAICYENMGEIKGYLTEKIWDCFKCSVIPVYLGASNITDFVPEDCFIDRRKFSSYSELKNYLQTMSNSTCKMYQTRIANFLKTKRALRWFDDDWGENMANLVVKLINKEKAVKPSKSDFFVFTEIYQCGKVGSVAIKTFLKYHRNQFVHVFGIPRDFEWLEEDQHIIFHDISKFNDVIKGFNQGHLGTALLWAKLIKDNSSKYLIHFDSDIVFRRESLRDITLKLKSGYDLVGPVRNYRNNPNEIDEVRNLSDVCQTLFFGFNREKVGNYNMSTLVRMCRGSYNPLGHRVIDFFDPVMFDILKNGGKVFYLNCQDYGGFDRKGNRAVNKFASENKIIDFGNKLVHFSAAGSGMNFYNNPNQVKNVPDSYRRYAIEKYALFCKLFYNETIDCKISSRDTNLLSNKLKI